MTSLDDLAAFLFARLDERDAILREMTDWTGPLTSEAAPGELTLDQRLVEVAALRSVVEIGHPETLRLLALPFVTHPDYRQEWRPGQ